MGYELKNGHYILICNNCGVKIDLVTCLELRRFKRENNWFTVFSKRFFVKEANWRIKEYCHSCALSLGYIKDQGEKLNEC